jgi:hypothetical protein
MCVEHERSVTTLGFCVSHSLLPHCRTALQAAPLLVGENVAPSVHAAHWRLAVALPPTDMPVPAAHVRQAAHAKFPALDLN